MLAEFVFSYISIHRHLLLAALIYLMFISVGKKVSKGLAVNDQNYVILEA